MQAITTQKVKTKVVNVVMSVSYDYSIKKEEFAKYAAKVLNGCLTLEKRGIRVNLYVLLALKYNQKVTVLIKIKDSKQAIDPLSIAYPIINASFLRRHIFSSLRQNQASTVNLWARMELLLTIQQI